MTFYVRYLESRKLLFRLDRGAWSRFDSVGWTTVEIETESFLLDPFVEEISADQAGALEAELAA